MPLLIGREAEVRRVLTMLGTGRSTSQSLLVLGEAGAGKTALLAVAAQRARADGTLVLAAQGSETETAQSFAALHQLLLPLMPDVESLPAHYRMALETAFGMTPAGPPHPMRLRMAVLALFSAAGGQGPVVVIVDDIQHFDRDSADVLKFVLRRLRTEAISVLLAARGCSPPDTCAKDLPVLTLGPLSPQAAAHLVDAQPEPPSGRARADLLAQAEGNPLAIIEFCRMVRKGGALTLPGGGLSRTLRVQELFATRLRELPAATRRLVLYAAASSDYEDLKTIMAAAGTGDDLEPWVPAEEAGLVTIAADRVIFRHPLVRAGAYHGASAAQRQRAHTDLAAALGADPARRAWHLAAACIGPDESVAAALEDTAELAERRGGFFAAAQALERSAECSPATADRARRYAKAIRAVNNSGDSTWVQELYRKVTSLTDDAELLGVAACGAGMAVSLSGRQRDAFQILIKSLEQHPPNDDRTTVALSAVLAAVASQSGLPEIRRPLVRLVDGLVFQDADTPYAELATTEAADATRAVAFAGADPDANATGLVCGTQLPSLLRPVTGAAETNRLHVLGAVAWWADESDLAVECFRQVFADLRAYGSMGVSAQSLAPMVSALIDTGRWEEADDLLDEAEMLAAVHKWRHVVVDVDGLRATLRALRGWPATGLPDSAWAAVDLEENRATHARLLRAAGTTAMAEGDFERAFRQFRSLFDENGLPLHYFLSYRSIADLAAVAQRIGRQEETAPVVAAVRAAVGRRPTVRMRLLLHHAAALAGNPAYAEHHFRLATADPAADQWPLARALARLHHAQWLRRRRRPLDARPLLTAALESFARLGAAGLAEQAHGELRASGVAVSPAKADALPELTAQQWEIVRLAAQGLRNREIGERLMISARTVSTHLYQVFPKLGVTSRHQLRDVLNDVAAPPHLPP
jgi:DNA-binding CsgD family transcriptional regulator